MDFGELGSILNIISSKAITTAGWPPATPSVRFLLRRSIRDSAALPPLTHLPTAETLTPKMRAMALRELPS